MNERQMEKLAAHFDKYFEQSRAGILHNNNEREGIDVSLYAPTEKYPWWKLVTAGASDYPQEGDRAELMMFVDYRVPILNEQGQVNANVIEWYYNVLMNAAQYPKQTGKPYLYRKVIEFNCGGEMRGVTTLLPKVIDDPAIFTCTLNENKTVRCYLLLTVTQAEIEVFKQKGVNYLDDYFFPQEGKIKFLCEPNRTPF